MGIFDTKFEIKTVSTAERTKILPDVPTLAQAGVTGYDSGAWYGFVVPKGTPKEIIEKLRAATVAAITSDLIKERFANEGAVPLGKSPDEFAAMMQVESKRWAEVLRSANIVIN